ncbi:hypothetical protein K470DRAFT_211246 [Piedraia hortae CBS 480.64]|uniref:DUF676 domain-containing protein n=1 Tax=Piedraia hortae CBS 480.64 TaxID=1314780 RepID=A0A6A7C6X5_9PEZI|nr:hypothetical protein K470DRAFT_211246 [Piedraia hortae CBS 480.64]
MPSKTLLLIFIHGFKGNDSTFSSFPRHLRVALSVTLDPLITVKTKAYPRFETRGDLSSCVDNFTKWLRDRVEEVEGEVDVLLCGHSMGGIVAVEALLKLERENNIEKGVLVEDRSTRDDLPPEEIPLPPSPSPVIPVRIKGILAFDTPYLGISPGLLAHGAEQQYNTASSAWKAYSRASRFFGLEEGASGREQQRILDKALPAADGSSNSSASWAKYALYGAAVVGAAGAAYLSRNQLTQGYAWATSHLEFVNCLARGKELQRRLENVVELKRAKGVEFANFYTCLSDEVSSRTQNAGSIVGRDRTFCVVPKSATQREKKVEDEVKEDKGSWIKCVNSLAGDEIRAHTTMFVPERNPDYHNMVQRARGWIVNVLGQNWS